MSTFDNFTYKPGIFVKGDQRRADAALTRCRKAFDKAGWKRPESWQMLRDRYYINRALKLYIPAMVDWINRPSTMFQKIQMDRLESGAKRIVINKGRNIR